MQPETKKKGVNFNKIGLLIQIIIHRLKNKYPSIRPWAGLEPISFGMQDHHSFIAPVRLVETNLLICS